MNDDKAVLDEFGKRWTQAEVAQDVRCWTGRHMSPIAVPPGAPQQTR